MKKRMLLVITTFSFLLSLPFSVIAHPGKTDANGGHYNRKTGEYHYHNRGGSSSSSSGGGSSSYSKPKPKPVYATKVIVSNMPSSINIGENVKLNGSAYPSNAEDQEISWESSNPSVATVDKNGNLIAVGVGNVVISAKTSSGTTSKYDLTVKAIAAQSISISGKVEELVINETVELSVIFNPDNTTYKNVEWKSDDESIISVDENGKITALAVGKTTITAISNNLTDSFEVEVKPILAESIEISCINNETGEEYEELKFKEGEEMELKATVLPVNVTDSSVKWSVDNTNIATVDQSGKLIMISEGTVIVTAQTSNGITDEIEVTVEAYKNSLIVDVIAGFIVFLLCIGVIGAPVLLVFWIRKKSKRNK